MLQNSEMLAEGELRSNLDDSDRVRDLQDKVADLKAEVILIFLIIALIFKITIQLRYKNLNFLS